MVFFFYFGQQGDSFIRNIVCVCVCYSPPVSHTVQDLVFIWNMTDPLVVNTEIELPQQDISNNYTTDCTIEYSTGNFTCLAVVFNLRRRLGYHLFHTYIPSALIVVMSWISFWIKPEAIPARVTLGVTSLLTLGMRFFCSVQYISLSPVVRMQPHRIRNRSNRCRRCRTSKRWTSGCRRARYSYSCR